MTRSHYSSDETITTNELSGILQRGDAVTVLDVRPEAERKEWHIPGSIHKDAYEALKRHDPNALDDVDLPDDRPVITVCAAGNTSRTAAEILRARGMQAVSLAGGMKAWSLAYNTADVRLSGVAVDVLQVRRAGKGCLSYLIGAGAEATIIDAALPPEVYVELAEARGLRITRVIDTHVHADHLSRSRPLAELTGSRLYLPEQKRTEFSYEPLHEGDVLAIGDTELRAIHTPGHTDESTCFLLDEAAIFTGDTLFVDGVGRPDLKATKEETRTRAETLYTSLQRLIGEVPHASMVLPGHTSRPVPFDGVMIGEPLGVVRKNVAALSLPKFDFVQFLVDRIPPAPANFERIVRLNEAGVAAVDDVLSLEAGSNRCAIS